MKHVVIIGGGISGLATGALLGKKGLKVTLVEKNATLGGRARTYKKKGYIFDMGPSWYMMPEVFEKFFSNFNKKSSDFYSLTKLNPRYEVVFDDDTSFIANNISDDVHSFEKFEKGSSEKIKTYLSQMKKVYSTSLKLLYFDTTEVKEWLSLNRILLGVRLMMTYPFYLSWYDFASRFTHNKKILQILTFPSVFLGGSPHNTPALYAMLSSADFTGGIWYPKGGMNQIIAALENLLKKYKVTIIKNHDVTRINTKNGCAEYILLDNGKKIYADVFIGACDLYHLETSLLKKVDRSYDKQYWKKRTKAISAILLYIGINKKIKANHHTLFFNSDWDNHFDAIFNNKRPYNNPSFYVSIPSASDDSVAPRNATNMFVLVPTAANLKISKNYYKKYAASILRILEKKFGSFVDNLEVLKIYSPQDFNMDYNAYQGTALGIAHTLKQSIFLRPKTRSKKISNLYYVGQYTQPGIGVPMCLISAEIVSNQIRNEK